MGSENGVLLVICAEREGEVTRVAVTSPATVVEAVNSLVDSGFKMSEMYFETIGIV